MKAYRILAYSKKAPLELVELPIPEPQADEVLIQICATSINPLDLKLKQGDFKLLLPYQMPLILGHDLAGKIVQVGPQVKHFQVGDEVFARPSDFRIGTFAEYLAVQESDVALKPRNWSMEQAASLPLIGLTAWQALVERANVQKGQKVFIQAGSGGVGTLAIQLAKQLGAFVATTTSAENADLVKSLGADAVIDYRTQDFETELQDYDVVLHSQDTKTLEKSLRILKKGGKMVSISGPPDPRFAESKGLNWFMKMVIFLLSRKVLKQAQKEGKDYSFLFMKADGKQLAQLSTMAEEGNIQPVIDQVFPFEQLNEAFVYVEKGRAKGKVVVSVGQ